ncbi:hypothetical protein GCM10010156_06210 [Planobispora rosea]|uniref:Uncharacterized protein n=1 Tax=Planobispora rosea TaxID=35762 RepID=A0A8J3RVC9_PLARO|nr:hypothetical protein [Planobispora rosea]GGS50250.1 hypothetical protein GCM10010156_06210 [Planobispora rosea]GIH82492.1 hypothetical protein Pro02_09000 [Planobispora rosea]
MNDRPDRLVHGRPTRADEDTQPQVPPQRDDAAQPGEPVPPGQVLVGHVPPGKAPARQVPADQVDDAPGRETPLTDADRADSAERVDVPHPGGRPGPEHAGPDDRRSAQDPVPGHGAAPPQVPVQEPQRSGRVSLFGQDPEDVRRRWQEVQAGFVDDPRQAVEHAASLLGEVTEAIRTALEARAADLQGRWKNGGQDAAEGGDTERLRTVLRDYRATLEELLGMPVTSVGKR